MGETKTKKTRLVQYLKLIKKEGGNKKIFSDDDDEDDADLGDQQDQDEEHTKTQGLVLELPLMFQAYRYLVHAGEKGLYQKDFLKLLKGFGSLEARYMTKAVCKSGNVKMIMVDRGKQRIQKFIAKDFLAMSSITKKFLAEARKMKEVINQSGTNTLSITTGERSDLPAIMNQPPTLQQLPDIPAIESAAPEEQALVPFAQPSTMDSNDMEIVDISTTNNIERVLEQPPSLPPTDAVVVHTHELVIPPPDIVPYNETPPPQPSHSKVGEHQTARKMRRTHFILSYVNKEKVLEGFTSLLKLLGRKERTEGIKSKVDRKTIIRTVKRMHDDNLLIYRVMPIVHHNDTKMFEFIMSLDATPYDIRAAIEQVHFRQYCMEWRQECIAVGSYNEK